MRKKAKYSLVVISDVNYIPARHELMSDYLKYRKEIRAQQIRHKTPNSLPQSPSQTTLLSAMYQSLNEEPRINSSQTPYVQSRLR